MTTKYRTVSIPKPLADDIVRLNDEIGYWPSVGAFVREATIAKLHVEREKHRAVVEAEG